MTYQQATIFCVAENGERSKLGHEIFHGENRHDQIREYLMDHYWDSRLESASCCPDVEIEKIEDDES